MLAFALSFRDNWFLMYLPVHNGRAAKQEAVSASESPICSSGTCCSFLNKNLALDLVVDLFPRKGFALGVDVGVDLVFNNQVFLDGSDQKSGTEGMCAFS